MTVVGTDPMAESAPGSSGEQVGAAERPEAW